MRFGSLFAGIGGFELGLESVGMTCAWQVEIDKFCLQVLEKNFPHVRRYEDVREVHGVASHSEEWREQELATSDHRQKGEGKPQEQFGLGTGIGVYRRRITEGVGVMGGSPPKVPSCPSCLPAVDLICGGFPCQPFSVAGKQRGEEDDRHLWPEMFRIIQEVRPRWVLGENVPGIIRLGLHEVLSDLESAGYRTQTFVIPACAVDAPHRRDRIWICGYNPDAFRNSSGGAHGGDRGERERGREEQDKRKRSEVGSHTGDVREDVPHTISLDDDRGRHGTSEVRREQREEARVQGCEDVADSEVGTLWAGLREGRPAGIRGGRSCDGGREGREDVADADGGGLSEFSEAHHEYGSDASRNDFGGCDEDVAYADYERPQGRETECLQECAVEQSAREGSPSLPDTDGSGEASGGSDRGMGWEREPASDAGDDDFGRWEPEPELGRVAHGIPRRVDRLRSLGNAVVPKLVAVLGQFILQADRREEDKPL